MYLFVIQVTVVQDVIHMNGGLCAHYQNIIVQVLLPDCWLFTNHFAVFAWLFGAYWRRWRRGRVGFHFSDVQCMWARGDGTRSKASNCLINIKKVKIITAAGSSELTHCNSILRGVTAGNTAVWVVHWTIVWIVHKDLCNVMVRRCERVIGH